MEVSVNVKDSGMMIVTSVTPDFRWQSGTAAIQLRLSGPLTGPTVRFGINGSRAFAVVSVGIV